MITYAPIDKAYNISPEQAEVVEAILTSRNQLQTRALEVSSSLTLAVIFIALAIIWVPNRNERKNT
ncbi:hypothetical protein QFX18_19130 [Saccharophagus degradans]|nr:hypothetical protein [Saccharophagus degradans]WGO98123.1 hypothetical protein QFX18_19130 [Saccharophagus degradans]